MEEKLQSISDSIDKITLDFNKIKEENLELKKKVEENNQNNLKINDMILKLKEKIDNNEKDIFYYFLSNYSKDKNIEDRVIEYSKDKINLFEFFYLNIIKKETNQEIFSSLSLNERIFLGNLHSEFKSITK